MAYGHWPFPAYVTFGLGKPEHYHIELYSLMFGRQVLNEKIRRDQIAHAKRTWLAEEVENPT